MEITRVKAVITDRFTIFASLWMLSMVLFGLITKLDRSNIIFVQTLIIPLGGYLLLFYCLEINDIEFNKSRQIIFWVFTILIKIFVLTFPIMLSEDIYRYIWDGRVQHAGINPYKYSPDAPELTFLRDHWWTNINNSHVPSPYPPFSQMIFWLITIVETDVEITILVLRILISIIDIGVILLLQSILQYFKLPTRRVIFYAWSPLSVLEFSSNAHNDVIALFFMLLSIYLILDPTCEKIILSGIFLSLAFLSKTFPIVALPFLVIKWRIKGLISFILSTILIIFPYYTPSINPLFPPGQKIFIRYFRFNESIFRMMDWFFTQRSPELGEKYARIFYSFIMVVLAGIIWVKYLTNSSNYALVKSISIILFFGLLLGPDVQPWYVLWILTFGIIVMDFSSITLSITVLFSYYIYPEYDRSDLWQEDWFMLLLQYIPVYLILMYQIWKKNYFDLSQASIETGVD